MIVNIVVWRSALSIYEWAVLWPFKERVLRTPYSGLRRYIVQTPVKCDLAQHRDSRWGTIMHQSIALWVP